MSLHKLVYRFGESHFKRADKNLEEWGYERRLEDYGADDEIVLIEVGAGVAWVWFEMLEHDSALVHFCASPEHRRKWHSARFVEGVRWALELLGIEYCYIVGKSNDKVLESDDMFSIEKYALKNGFRRSLKFDNAWVRDV